MNFPKSKNNHVPYSAIRTAKKNHKHAVVGSPAAADLVENSNWNSPDNSPRSMETSAVHFDSADFADTPEPNSTDCRQRLTPKRTAAADLACNLGTPAWAPTTENCPPDWAVDNCPQSSDFDCNSYWPALNMDNFAAKILGTGRNYCPGLGQSFGPGSGTFARCNLNYGEISGTAAAAAVAGPRNVADFARHCRNHCTPD